MSVTAPEVGLYGVTAKNVTENDQAPVWVFKVMQVLEDGNAVKGWWMIGNEKTWPRGKYEFSHVKDKCEAVQEHSKKQSKGKKGRKC
uniref:Uncharacterized protein n=1 Tax=Chromera velia CCMP2878 TaxID=1169474 RepID=A0A0G4FCT8_9ALVE|eukprot:Cvel_16403.t1-p1 / transcript=Cvel_16403.t1 / gene=Cvel_16403 / organism=Chromera_velia_CCMP2878 / gene_product=hypothetical protein / transcript_product=hypothetical protein / location=Cvel_scaffold1262:43739-44155(+) / protein_length=86 / sequence_SO=supercontig / SO=protein_coding / is_pseudo=false